MMCFLHGNIVTCARYGPIETANVTKETYGNLKAQSQLAGFQLLLVGTMLVVVSLAIKQCCIKATTGKRKWRYPYLRIIEVIKILKVIYRMLTDSFEN